MYLYPWHILNWGHKHLLPDLPSPTAMAQASQNGWLETKLQRQQPGRIPNSSSLDTAASVSALSLSAAFLDSSIRGCEAPCPFPVPACIPAQVAPFRPLVLLSGSITKKPQKLPVGLLFSETLTVKGHSAPVGLLGSCTGCGRSNCSSSSLPRL